MSIKDTQIQALPSKSHVQSDGSNIGGVPPKDYGALLIPGSMDLLLRTEGNTGKPTDYPAWMVYPATPRPILANTGHVRMSFEATIGGNMQAVNVRETDLMIVTGNYLYNMSAQYQQQLGFEIADKNGDWKSAGFNQGPLQRDIPYRVAIDYAFDLKAHTCSILQITQNGTTSPVLPSLQKIPGQPSTWQEGAYMQIQLGSMPSAEAWQMKVSGGGDGLCLEWS